LLAEKLKGPSPKQSCRNAFINCVHSYHWEAFFARVTYYIAGDVPQATMLTSPWRTEEFEMLSGAVVQQNPSFNVAGRELSIKAGCVKEYTKWRCCFHDGPGIHGKSSSAIHQAQGVLL